MNIPVISTPIRIWLAAMLLGFSTLALSAETVNINKADTAALIANLQGIGEVKAKAIVDYRRKHGPFQSINDLANVKGIGEGLIKKNKKYLSVNRGASVAKQKSTKKSSSKDRTGSTTATKNQSTKNTQKKDKKQSAKQSKKSTANSSPKKKLSKKKSTSGSKSDKKKQKKSSKKSGTT